MMQDDLPGRDILTATSHLADTQNTPDLGGVIPTLFSLWRHRTKKNHEPSGPIEAFENGAR